MSRRERVVGAPGTAVASSVQPQSPWGAAATTGVLATSADSPEQQATEVAVFAPSASPPPDSPTKDQTDQAEIIEDTHSATGRKPAPADGFADVQGTACQDVQQGAAAGLLGTAKQLRASYDTQKLLKQPQKAEAKQPRLRHKKGTADIHLIGEVVGAFGFGSECMFCTWQLVHDVQLWSVTRGLDKGRTHASSPLLPEDGGVSGVVWETPIDLALATTSIQHWPALVFKLFHRSLWLGRDEFVGYGLCTLPNTPGCHHISCPVWAAVESHKSFKQEITSWFTGLMPQLVDEGFITDLEQRYEQGQHLQTRDCSSSALSFAGSSYASAPVTIPAAKAVERIGAAEQPGLHCRSFGSTGAAGSTAAAAAGGGLAGSGGRICLRLHLLARGLNDLKLSGGEGIGACLERLQDNIQKMRRHKELAPATVEEAESEGVRLVREGRAARLAAVQQQLDVSSSRDGSFSAGKASRAGRLSPSRNTLRFQSRDGLAAASSVAGSTSSLMATGRFASRDGGAPESAAAGSGSSPMRYSRAGRLGSSPSRAAATSIADGDPHAAGVTGTTNSDDYASPTGWRPGSLSAVAAGAGEVPGCRGGQFDSTEGTSTSQRGGSRRAGQYTSSLLRNRGSSASPTEQQGLWSGGRSAPVVADSASGGGAVGGGSRSSGPGLLLRRGTQLQTLGKAARQGVTDEAAGVGSPVGSDAGGAALLLPPGADHSSS